MPLGPKWSSKAAELRITLSAWCHFRYVYLLCVVLVWCACVHVRSCVCMRMRVRKRWMCDVQASVWQKPQHWQRGQTRTWPTHATSLSKQGPMWVRKYRPALQHYLTKIVGPMFEPPINFTLRFEVSLYLSLSHIVSLLHTQMCLFACRPFDVRLFLWSSLVNFLPISCSLSDSPSSSIFTSA